ncbi:carbamoyltransferase HypF [Yersinia ruckeri]|uniref:carbamoyltransferase HypF n=1 Tax=Yersinia ruckeri TaxID=29486 RepID=UPI00202B26D8|nr:carbamoyltransferase HypF [Yersinia ruckeri]EKN4181576.1 carbamoyltransferase HypF [Yersinia ruckeri]MCK8554263.1 carbamoyltransferase HypF [Yersinia ruckeri]
MSDSALHIRIRGKVQAVGFRPFIWQLANKLRLSGEVCNDGSGVDIRLVQSVNIDLFIEELQRDCPPLARIDQILFESFDWLTPPQDFTITTSQQSPMETQVTPDAATCPACLKDITQPDDRRFGYAFTNCTHCGPRFTIIHSMPYDRAATSMAAFTLCPACQQEYQNPADRRFHAQPVACPQCGPQISASRQNATILAQDADAIQSAVAALRSGKIVAIKGLGGFHLACDATQQTAVVRLRERKQRPTKPLAVMLPSINWLAQCSDDHRSLALRDLLQSPAAPIVLTRHRASSPLCAAIAPNLDEVGLMLPFTPLHHLLMQAMQTPLVMTSGNSADCAPVITNNDARRQLVDIADLWLLHNRDIVQRVDDSLVRWSPQGNEVLRRARGYVPDALRLPAGFACQPPLLALGGDLKNTFCLVKGNQAILSAHFGSLNRSDIARQQQQAIEHFQQLYHCTPRVIVHDAHPAYVSHQRQQQPETTDVDVLHHHAHIAACLGEHQWPLDGSHVIGLALDGLGYAAPGALWGGECFQVNYLHCEHLGGLPAVALAGGDRASQEPWRNLLAQWQAFVPNWQARPEAKVLLAHPWQPLSKAIMAGVNSPLASSCGRLFDAVSTVLGCAPDTLSWEGEAACRLEALAHLADGVQHPISIPLTHCANGTFLDLATFWQQWLDWSAAPAARAFAFHDALAQGFAALAHYHSARTGIHTVALAGGVLHNRLLRQRLHHHLAPLHVLMPHNIPAGDGGLALGQALIACARRQTAAPDAAHHTTFSEIK